MEKYSVLSVIGEGSYGKVIKCRHNDTGLIVAIKKFIETEDDSSARKVALREIRMLKKLHHPHLVCLLEVFRRKKRFHLVFEYMQSTLLEKLEEEGPLHKEVARKYFYQILKGVDYCHTHNIIHRDIKPENILISELGIVKLCDFGFARFATVSTEPFTDYVATRWYRAPELLIGDICYGRGVDIWALGCILIEMLTAAPLFTGDSDIDQLYQITRLVGGLTAYQKSLMSKQSEDLVSRDSCEDDELIDKIRTRSPTDGMFNLEEKYPTLSKKALNLVISCLRMDPDERSNSEELLRHPYFTWDKFLVWFLPELQKKVNLEASKKVQVCETPHPSIDSSVLASMVGPRRPTKLKGEWSIDVIQDSPLKDCPFFSEARKLRTKLRESVETEKEIELAHVNQQEISSIADKQRNGQTKKEDIYLEKKDMEIDMPKINVVYKRNMIPDSFYIKPVRGRLIFDKEGCKNHPLQKNICEEICLPQIRDSSNRFPKNPKHLDSKSEVGFSAKGANQEQEETFESEISENMPGNFSLLKRKKAVMPDSASSKSQNGKKEKICTSELERERTEKEHLPEV